ncbi:MAG: hypothetical protein ACD_29C00071G0002 [uncultured bacterium]|nr:MAG: hypothetical protein ACD_29C00071G0002 [uncultured bacterium]
MTHLLNIQSVLISVSDKTGLIAFAKKLTEYNIQIISTGGTFEALKAASISAIKVSDITQFPEMMSGRVKTLHPKIHGGILGKRDQHDAEAKKYDIRWIDCVVCNLYPFEKTISQNNIFSECIEQIDIGGPAMIRAAAKNIDWVTVISDSCDYDLLLEKIKMNKLDVDFRKKMSAKAFAHTAQYDSMIANYLNSDDFPEQLILPLSKISDCRYGENPHQKAAVYKNMLEKNTSILDAKLIQGKPLSFNNFNDSAAALNTIIAYQSPACVIVKHANPCGVAIADHIDDAFNKAWHADSLSAFGSIIALNKTCDEKIAEFLISVFIEVIIAPEFSESALTILSKKPNIRVLLQKPFPKQLSYYAPKWIAGGMLLQTSDDSECDENHFKIVTQKKPNAQEIRAMKFSWPVLKQLKSNAILISKEDVTLGIGAGQVSRIDAIKVAIQKAGANNHGAILASDAFFPFTDSIEMISKTNIKAIIQPGGSIKDRDVIAACDQHDIAMVFTNLRCFNH